MSELLAAYRKSLFQTLWRDGWGWSGGGGGGGGLMERGLN